ncbi:MAG: E3 binding domain-containing protein [Anaerolineae bacterium]
MAHFCWLLKPGEARRRGGGEAGRRGGAGKQEQEARGKTELHLNANLQLPITNYQSPISNLNLLSSLPLARKIAHDLGVKLENVTGTGPRGRITEDDVRRLWGMVQLPGIQNFREVCRPRSSDERIPVRGVRRRIAETMAESVTTIPQVVSFPG